MLSCRTYKVGHHPFTTLLWCIIQNSLPFQLILKLKRETKQLVEDFYSTYHSYLQLISKKFKSWKNYVRKNRRKIKMAICNFNFSYRIQLQSHCINISCRQSIHKCILYLYYSFYKLLIYLILYFLSVFNFITILQHSVSRY